MVFEIGTVAGLAIIAGGMMVNYIRNGKSQARSAQKLEGKTDAVLERLNDEVTGLSAINKEVANFRLHCEHVSTALTGRVDTAERDIKEIKQG